MSGIMITLTLVGPTIIQISQLLFRAVLVARAILGFQRMKQIFVLTTLALILTEIIVQFTTLKGLAASLTLLILYPVWNAVLVVEAIGLTPEI